MNEFVRLVFENKVAKITIDRPKVLNALSEQVIRELRNSVQEVKASDARVVVFGSSGDKAFVAGADIAAMSRLSGDEAITFAQNGQALTCEIEALPQLTIARVQGFALGGGCELAMACDVVVASEKAKFGQPEVGLGLIAGFGGTQRLIGRVGVAVAMDMLCAHRNLSGQEAYHLGLVSRVCAPDKLDQEVALVVKGALKAGPLAVAETKRLARLALDVPLSAGLEAEASAFGSCFGREEAREGMGAFCEKRSANFVQK